MSEKIRDILLAANGVGAGINFTMAVCGASTIPFVNVAVGIFNIFAIAVMIWVRSATRENHTNGR